MGGARPARIMIDMNSFGVIGGDKRQIALAESIAADGYTVYTYALELADFSKAVRTADLDEITSKCENIIFPLPVTADGKYLNAPYCERQIRLDDEFAEAMRHKQVFGGMLGKLRLTSELWEATNTYDYYTREEFAIHNAVPTAEGALEIAMRECSGTVSGSRCLVAGFGRIGKALAWVLRGVGAQVTVSARKPADLAWISLYGYEPIKTENIFEQGQYDIVFNTVPSIIFNRKTLSKAKPGTLLIDLASSPGGVDFEAAEKLRLQAVQALSLPGKVAPKAAGEIIKNTIYNMMEE